MNLIYLDTETTDREKSSRLVQLAYKHSGSGEVVNEYFKPPVPISFGAMAVHHITNAMVEDRPAFIGSDCHSNLQELLKNGIAVAHNADFDIWILKNEGVNVGEHIDTLRVARHILNYESYKLQYLRYALGLNADGVAHDALGDVLILEKLFEYLKNSIAKDFSLSSDKEIIFKMTELTNMPVLLDSFIFGKYKGRSFKEIGREDQGYLHWLYGSETEKDVKDQNEDLVYTLKQYLN